ncbi:hypothetical protein Tco_0574969 [Tanacetum coccineum]
MTRNKNSHWVIRKGQVGANSSIYKANAPSTSNSFDLLKNVDVGDECGVSSSMGNHEEEQAAGHATASKHTSCSWNEDFESNDEVDEVIFPEGQKEGFTTSDKTSDGFKKFKRKKNVKKPVKKIPDSQSGEGTSKSPKWTKKQILNSKKVNCPFRLYASWMSREHSFQIKSLRSEHKCCRNYNLGSLVTYKWIAVQYFKEIIEDPFIPLRKMRDDIRQKFMIDVSVGQCKRAKQLALFDHEGGLIEHYAKLYQYRQAILDSNPGSTCTLDVVESDNGSVSFKRMYICFKGVKDGWLAGCRKVIGLDGCFLKHTCRGELLTAMGRDANNQMYPIAWAVVRVENADNWGWFLHLLHDDLCLNDGTGITIISDSHKGLIDAVNDWLPEAEHRKCTRHIYANFKKKYSGLQYQRLFWAAASCTLEQQFLQIMDQIKLLDANAYDYLIQRDPNSWSRAFFEMDRRCAAFENGISESFNRAILGPRMKPIITMLEEIRLYIMQRLVAMNKLAFSLEDTITPSIRKRLEILKEKQREWVVYPSGFQELEVRKGDQSYGVSLQHKVCQCRLWELSGIPCVHAVAAYMHVGTDLDAGVSHWYSREAWFNAYQFSIKPVFGTNMWKRTNDVPPLPPIIRKIHGRPKKKRIPTPGETSGSQVSWVGRTMTCKNCWEKGHNKASCKKDPQPKPEVEKKPPSRNKQVFVGQCASRGGGRSGRGGGNDVSSSYGILTAEHEYQLELDEQAFRECMEEQAREQAKIDAKQGKKRRTGI